MLPAMSKWCEMVFTNHAEFKEHLMELVEVFNRKKDERWSYVNHNFHKLTGTTDTGDTKKFCYPCLMTTETVVHAIEYCNCYCLEYSPTCVPKKDRKNKTSKYRDLANATFCR